MQLFSKKLSQIYLVLFVSAFLTITGNFTFFEKTILVYPLSENWPFLGSLFLLLFTLLAALLLIFCYKKTIKPILILLLLISAIVSYSTNNYGIVFDHNMITNTFETDTSEFLDLVSFKSILYFFIFGLLPSIAVWKVKLKEISFKAQFWERVKAFLILVVIIAVVLFSFYKHYSSFARENYHLRTYTIPSYYL
jgi:lipid A ethanolaminephosphotransferase